MKYSSDVYEYWNPFEGDMDTDVRCETRKIVNTRTPHECTLGEEFHEIKPGTMAMVDIAIVDGKWCSQYFCIDCVDKWLEEIGFVEVKHGSE